MMGGNLPPAIYSNNVGSQGIILHNVRFECVGTHSYHGNEINASAYGIILQTRCLADYKQSHYGKYGQKLLLTLIFSSCW